MEELEKKSVETKRRPRTSTEPDTDFPKKETDRRRTSSDETVDFPKKETGRRPSVIDLVSSGGGGGPPDNPPDNKNRLILDAAVGKDIFQGLASMYDPDTYTNKQTKDYISSILKTPELSKVNNRQKSIDIAADDVGRVTELQRLLLTDPIVGEADPDTVVSLYNTLAKANPEIVKDKNLLRFALREALQYDAVPLHTYKDLISMGKDRADMQEKMQRLEDRKYSI